MNDSIEAATPGDLSAIDNLLQACSLPVADIAAGQVEFFVSGHARQMMGCVGVEPLDGACLLRSLAVKTASRSTGLGRRLVEYALNHAAANRYGAVYLLTNDADQYFARLQFARTERHLAPTAVSQSTQFSTLCPDSAVLMCHRNV